MAVEHDFELHGFTPAFGKISASPFVVKSLIHVGLAGAPAKIRLNGDIMRAPKGKMPYIVLNDGRKIADSEFIYTHLCENYGLDLTSHLSEAEQGQGYLLARAFEEHVYFVILLDRWKPNDHWQDVRRAYFDDLPPVVKQVFPSFVRRSILKSAKGHGMARHDMADVYAYGCRSLRALVPLLGDKPYLFGDKISYADTCIGPQVHGCFGGVTNPMGEVFDEFPQLTAYADRVVAHAARPEHGPGSAS